MIFKIYSYFCIKIGYYMVSEFLYIQKSISGSTVYETVADFEMYCMDIPFIIFGEAKELPKNEWKDENGDDEYIPSTLCMESYEMTVKFAYKGTEKSANTKINAFLRYLTGIDGSGAEMSMYSTYTQIGRRNIRFVKVSDDAELIRDKNGDILMFEVTFKVNDPTTNIAPVKTNGVVTSLTTE